MNNNDDIKKKIGEAEVLYRNLDISSAVRTISDILTVNPEYPEALDIKTKISKTLIEYKNNIKKWLYDSQVYFKSTIPAAFQELQKLVDDLNFDMIAAYSEEENRDQLFLIVLDIAKFQNNMKKWLADNDEILRSEIPDVLPALQELVESLRYDRITELKKNKIALLLALYMISKRNIEIDKSKIYPTVFSSKLKTYAGEWNRKGVDLGNLGKYDEAIERFDMAIELNPKYKVAWHNKGYAFFKLGKYNEAIKYYDKAIEIDEKFAPAWYRKGNVLFDLGKYNEALNCFDRVTENDNNYLDALSNKGNAFYNLEEYEEAIKCFDKVITIDPNYAKGWSGKGSALYNLKKYDEAIRCYDKAIEINPNDIDAWIGKGNALFDSGKYEDAIKHFDKAIKIDPGYARAWNDKGNALYNLEEYEEAIEHFDKAIKIDPSYAKAWNDKGNVLYNLEKYNKAIECYDKAIELDPNHPYSWNGKGTSLRAIGEYSRAEQCYNEALNLDPKNVDALNRLGLIYSEIYDDYRKALQISKRALSINPDDFLAKSNIAENLIKEGLIKEPSIKDRRYEEARKYAFQALNETQDTFYQCIIRFLILSSYLLENDAINSDKELAKFFYYYRSLNGDTKLEEKWTFKGLIKAINKSDAALQTKFLLLILIDLLQGRIDRQRLSSSMLFDFKSELPLF